MEVRFLIISLACLSCLVPPALGTGLVAKAAALGGLKGAAIGGIKGAAIGAGIGLAKKIVGLKSGGILAAKKAAISGLGSLVTKGLRGISAATGFISTLTRSTDCQPVIFRTPLTDVLTGATTLVRALQPCVPARVQTPVVYRIVTAPRVLAVRLPNKEE